MKDVLVQFLTWGKCLGNAFSHSLPPFSPNLEAPGKALRSVCARGEG